METVLIVYNRHKSHASDLASEIELYLQQRGYRVLMSLSHQDEKESGINAEELFLIISIGGDGTVLGIARSYPGTPVLALNAGSVGFITETPMEEWRQGFEEFCCGEATVSKRLMLEVKIFRNGQEIFHQIGLNDLVVSSEGISRLVDLFVQVDGDSLGRFRADGVIVATPTGSTAYSAAAGGPVLYPEMEAFVVTPICPFSLSSRAVVVGGDKKLSIMVEPEQRTSLNLTVDGQILVGLLPEDRIEISGAPQHCRIVQCRERNFFQVLRDKLHWSGGPND